MKKQNNLYCRMPHLLNLSDYFLFVSFDLLKGNTWCHRFREEMFFLQLQKQDRQNDWDGEKKAMHFILKGFSQFSKMACKVIIEITIWGTVAMNLKAKDLELSLRIGDWESKWDVLKAHQGIMRTTQSWLALLCGQTMMLFSWTSSFPVSGLQL